MLFQGANVKFEPMFISDRQDLTMLYFTTIYARKIHVSQIPLQALWFNFFKRVSGHLQQLGLPFM